MAPSQAIALLRRQIESGNRISQASPIDEGEFEQWQLVTKNVLEKSFGTNSSNVTDFENAGKLYFATSGTDWQAHYRNRLALQVPRLIGLAELIETEEQLNSGSLPQAHSVGVVPSGHGIFLVHGHNEAALQAVARFLEKLKQQVIVLREQPNRGQTIIEKFEAYSNVGFTVVLLTADDEVLGSNGGPAVKRARQNVVFELGYFIGRLGRNRVCALYEPNVELPSDYSGVLYHELDSRGSWQLSLARELRAAGLPVDMNDAL